MNQEDTEIQSNQDNEETEQDYEEIEKWIERDLNDVLNEAEDKGFIKAVKEMAEWGGWIEPETVEEYLMWFDVAVERAIKGALYCPNSWSSNLYEAHHMAAYAAELRCLGIQPAPKPWKYGILKMNPEILEGMKTVSSLVTEYGRTTADNFIGHIYPLVYMRRTVAMFDDIELSSFNVTDEEADKIGRGSEVLLARNLVQQFSYLASCLRDTLSDRQVNYLAAFESIWHHAEVLYCKPKKIVNYAIELWRYRVAQAEKGKLPELDAECAIILPPKEPTFDSPIEEMFWKAWKAQTGIRLLPQYEIGKYRVDFAHPLTRVVIELDGLIAHQTTEQIAKDRRRQREIEAMGWKVIRFGGKEIYHNAQQCAAETENFIRIQQKEKQQST